LGWPALLISQLVCEFTQTYSQEAYRAEGIPDSPHYLIADETTNAMGIAYFEVNRDEIMARMKKHGAVLIR
jgi:hypothetical protein